MGLVGLSIAALYFMGPKVFLPGISWVQTFPRGRFVGSKVFHLAVLCVCVWAIVNESNLTQNWRNWRDFFREVNTEF